MSDQLLWLRKVGLLVYNPAPSSSPATPGNGLDLSNMHITFDVQQSNYETPNTLRCRVFNLKDTTQQLVYSEFTRVSLAAGYQNGPYGTIFDGTIKQIMRGRASATDTYLDIFAADGDIPYTDSKMNQTLSGPVGDAQKIQAINEQFGKDGLPAGYTLDLPPTASLPRGKVLYGLTRDYARDTADTIDADWSIQNGKVQWVPRTGYRPGEAVELDPRSGLVGIPTQTSGGINASTLLNPNIRCGLLVKINSNLINEGQSAANNLYGSGQLIQTGYNTKISQSGFYKVLVSEHNGDNRGNDWYTSIVCLAVDQTAPAGQAVKPYWAGGKS
jgi:hypothetical protein